MLERVSSLRGSLQNHHQQTSGLLRVKSRTPGDDRYDLATDAGAKTVRVAVYQDRVVSAMSASYAAQVRGARHPAKRRMSLGLHHRHDFNLQ